MNHMLREALARAEEVRPTMQAKPPVLHPEPITHSLKDQLEVRSMACRAGFILPNVDAAEKPKHAQKSPKFGDKRNEEGKKDSRQVMTKTRNRTETNMNTASETNKSGNDIPKVPPHPMASLGLPSDATDALQKAGVRFLVVKEGIETCGLVAKGTVAVGVFTACALITKRLFFKGAPAA